MSSQYRLVVTRLCTWCAPERTILYGFDRRSAPADDSRAYLVRYRSRTVSSGRGSSSASGTPRLANLVEVDRLQGGLIDPRLGRVTVGEWWNRWWPTVRQSAAEHEARDGQPHSRLSRRLTHADRQVGSDGVACMGRKSRVAHRIEPRSRHHSSGRPAPQQVHGRCARGPAHLAQSGGAAPAARIEHREIRFLTSDELLTLAATIDRRYAAFVLLGGFGGMRLGEMLGLRWGRVDLLGRRVRVAETLVDIAGQISFSPRKTKAAVRSVPLPGSSPTSSPSSQPPTWPQTDWCSSRRGLADSSHAVPSALLGAVAELAPLRIHDLRHTAVSLWIADGANPKQIAVMAGHTSVSVVLDRYGHLLPTG